MTTYVYCFFWRRKYLSFLLSDIVEKHSGLDKVNVIKDRPTRKRKHKGTNSQSPSGQCGGSRFYRGTKNGKKSASLIGLAPFSIKSNAAKFNYKFLQVELSMKKCSTQLNVIMSMLFQYCIIYLSDVLSTFQIDIPRAGMTMEFLTVIASEELGISAAAVERIRKLPNTRYGNDLDSLSFYIVSCCAVWECCRLCWSGKFFPRQDQSGRVDQEGWGER